MMSLSYLNKNFKIYASSQDKTITIFVSDSTNSRILLSKTNELPQKQYQYYAVNNLEFSFDKGSSEGMTLGQNLF